MIKFIRETRIRHLENFNPRWERWDDGSVSCMLDMVKCLVDKGSDHWSHMWL